MMDRYLEKRNHWRFGCMLGLLLLMVMFRYSLQIDLPRVFFLAVIGLIVLWGDQDEIVAMIICCIPLHESIDFFYALVICTVVYVFKFYRQIRIGANVILVLLMIVWELLHCFYNNFSIMIFITKIIPFLVLAVMMASDVEKLDYQFIVRMFAWVTLAVSITLFVKVLYFSGFNIPLAIAGLQRLGLDEHSSIENVKVAGGQINPNTLGIVTVLASSGLMQIRSTGHGRKSDLVLMCVMIVFAALGTSRTYLACLILMVALFICSEQGGIVKKVKSFGVLLALVVVAVLVMAILFPDSFVFYVSRFSDSDITTGRDTLMTLYHEFIVKNSNVLLFGIGLQDYGDRLIHFYRVADNVPHNSIQELIIAWGIPGLIFFVALFLSMYFVASRRNNKCSLMNFIPLIIIVFKGMAGQMLNSAYTMLAFSYAYLSLCADMARTSEGNQRYI